jgi:hypothetical protein
MLSKSPKRLGELISGAAKPFTRARVRRKHENGLRRIERAATPELVKTYGEGRLSLRAYERLSKLSPRRQRKAVELDRHKEQAQNLAAVAIRSVLARKPQRIDLKLIAAKIIESIRGRYAVQSE